MKFIFLTDDDEKTISILVDDHTYWLVICKIRKKSVLLSSE